VHVAPTGRGVLRHHWPALVLATSSRA
jgi:hypothetical protein